MEAGEDELTEGKEDEMTASNPTAQHALSTGFLYIQIYSQFNTLHHSMVQLHSKEKMEGNQIRALIVFLVHHLEHHLQTYKRLYVNLDSWLDLFDECV